MRLDQSPEHWQGWIGNLIAQGASEAYQYFEDKIKEAGGNVVDGILLGILDALLGIGSWIVDNVFKPILDGFKKCFRYSQSVNRHARARTLYHRGTFTWNYGFLIKNKEKI